MTEGRQAAHVLSHHPASFHAVPPAGDVAADGSHPRSQRTTRLPRRHRHSRCGRVDRLGERRDVQRRRAQPALRELMADAIQTDEYAVRCGRGNLEETGPRGRAADGGLAAIKCDGPPGGRRDRARDSPPSAPPRPPPPPERSYTRPHHLYSKVSWTVQGGHEENTDSTGPRPLSITDGSAFPPPPPPPRRRARETERRSRLWSPRGGRCKSREKRQEHVRLVDPDAADV